MGLFIKDDEKKEYTITIKCVNCYSTYDIDIPFGTTVEDHLNKSQLSCETCGCHTLTKEVEEQ